MYVQIRYLNLIAFRFMSDQEAWHELCSLYLSENEYSKAAFCMEEVLLHNPHSHLIHQRLAEIRYTMVSTLNVCISSENSGFFYIVSPNLADAHTLLRTGR